MDLVHKISSCCSKQTLSLGLGRFGMAEFKSALLFGVTIHFEMMMGQNSPVLVWFSLVWFGLVGMVKICLMEKEIFQYYTYKIFA